MDLAESFAQTVLRPFATLEPSPAMPLHAEGLYLQASGALDAAVPTLGIIGMWTPLHYRRNLINQGVIAPELSFQTTTTSDYYPICALQRRVREQPEPSLTDKITLARLSEYDLLTEFPSSDVLVSQLVVNQASLLLGRISPMQAITCLDKLATYQNASPFSLHIVDVMLTAANVQQCLVNEARSHLRKAQNRLYSGLEIPSWLEHLCYLRLRSLEGSIAFANEEFSLAIDIWIECVFQTQERSDTSVVTRWCYYEFCRRRLERLIRFLIRDGHSNTALELAELAIGIDPHDGRAWRLFGDVHLIEQPDKAAEAYQYALALDPTLTSSVSLAAGHALSVRSVANKAKAVFVVHHCLDSDPNNLKAVQLLQELVEDREHPLLTWTTMNQSEQRGWWFFLYRPIFDLGPRQTGPLFTYAPVFAFQRWQNIEDKQWMPNIQRVIMPSFRSALCADIRRQQYNVWSPDELPEHLQTDSWARLVDAVKTFDKLRDIFKIRVCGLLLCLGLYEFVLYLLRRHAKCRSGCSSSEAELGYIYAFAEYILLVGTQPEQYNTDRFEYVAQYAPQGSRAAFVSTLLLGVHAAKVERNASKSAKWLKKTRSRLDTLYQVCDYNIALRLWESRIHRAAAFIPFLEGNIDNALEELYVALSLVDSIVPTTLHENIVCAETRQTVLQTIAKTYEFNNDYESALSTLKTYVENDPLDYGAQLEIGEALFALGRYEDAAYHYQQAAILGPCGDRIGTFLAGEAYRCLGRPTDAMFMFIESLRFDPLGESPRVALRELVAQRQVVAFPAIQQIFASEAVESN
ncbi:MAG TPA: tetratricopeptide repeat protein [Pyrinomonadaceae bacterium]|nr:tetratricopeptide repeat protein [Pyrinomonadaceae bacterium]